MKTFLAAILFFYASSAVSAGNPEEAELKSPPPTVGSCRVGDKLSFTGGWVVGAAGLLLFSDPVAAMERLQDAGDRERRKMAHDSPARFRWNSHGVGCEGISREDPMPVYLSEPIGGGAIKGGRFLVVSAAVIGDNGRRGACYLLVDARDVRCRR